VYTGEKMVVRNGKKIWCEVSRDLYVEIERQADKRNITFTKYVNRVLMRAVIEDNRYENPNQDKLERNPDWEKI
jgi:hypothetical protein